MKLRPLAKIAVWGKTSPNTAYLTAKAKISDANDLWNTLEARCAEIDLDTLATDLKPFVTKPSEAAKVTLFRDFLIMKKKQYLPWPFPTNTPA